jgi:branched-subunit amino acid aminotransferase/4-amino-4-deoxychorismate lyase
VHEFREADEIFSTGNHSKIVPVTRIEDRDLQPGPIAKKCTGTLLGVGAFDKNELSS